MQEPLVEINSVLTCIGAATVVCGFLVKEAQKANRPSFFITGGILLLLGISLEFLKRRSNASKE